MGRGLWTRGLWILVPFLFPWMASAIGHWIEIRGTINPATAQYLSRAVAIAESQNSKLLLVELDTPGGLVTSVREMAQTIDRASLPVIVYTTPAGASATSAGAILTISSHLAVMAPGTNIGAAHPVAVQSGEMSDVMAEKAASDVSAFARSLAELRKRNAKAASEVVTKSTSYTAEEALKANLIEIVAASREELFKSAHGRTLPVGNRQITLETDPAPEIHFVEMTHGERILNYLSHPNVAAILMSLAILLIYAEMSSPGIGLAGILGGLCLIVAFIAFQALPIRTGGLVLLGLGTALLISEIFVASGGVLALGGTISMVIGLLWVVDPQKTDLRISPLLVGLIGFTLFAGTLAIGYGVVRVRQQSETALAKIGGGDNAGVRGYPGRVHSVEPPGRTGLVSVRGELWRFTSEESLNAGDPVVIVRNNGLQLEVTRAKEPSWKV